MSRPPRGGVGDDGLPVPCLGLHVRALLVTSVFLYLLLYARLLYT